MIETVKVTITGGPNAGTHEASGTRGGCSAGMTGPGSFGNQLSNPKDTDKTKLNSVQLIVPDAKKAAGGSGEFFVMVAFGPLMARGAEYTIDTQPTSAKKRGSGKVTVQDGGKTATVTFSGTTAEGVKLEGRIDCRSVIRNAG